VSRSRAQNPTDRAGLRTVAWLASTAGVAFGIALLYDAFKQEQERKASIPPWQGGDGPPTTYV
jgi:hypothetical protein